MNAILGYSEILMEEAQDKGQEEFIPDLEKIHASGNHLLSLINNILDLSKIEAGKMDLFLESFGISRVNRRSRQYRQAAGGKERQYSPGSLCR